MLPPSLKTAPRSDAEVATFRDVVQLSGFVDSEADKIRAEEIAGEVEGVASVDNSLIVKQ